MTDSQSPLGAHGAARALAARPSSVGPSSVGPATAGPSTAGPSKAESGGTPAFRALLERLEQQAAQLRASESGGAEQLGPAVGEARASLEAALSLGDQLLEAYRAALQREPGSGGSTR
jgi:hypothetical protein